MSIYTLYDYTIVMDMITISINVFIKYPIALSIHITQYDYTIVIDMITISITVFIKYPISLSIHITQ